MASAMQRIEAVVPESPRPVFGETALFAPSFHRNARVASHLPVMRRAIAEHRLLHFAYTRGDGAISLADFLRRMDDAEPRPTPGD